MRILAILGISLLLLMGVATPALAGVEPSPFQPQINQLNAVANDLAAIRSQLDAAAIRAGVKPSPWQPQVNRLNAIATQLGVLYDRVDAALTGVPRSDPKVITARVNVGEGAVGIIYDVAGLARVLPEECDDALSNVETGAKSIISLIGPVLFISDVAVFEGNVGMQDVLHKMFLSAPSDQPVTVDCYTSGGTATPDVDFVSIPITAPITLTFLPGQTTGGAIIQIIGDTIVEGDETFFVNFINPTNVIMLDSQGQFTIWDDD